MLLKEIKTLDPKVIADRINHILTTYPKGSISPREVVESFELKITKPEEIDKLLSDMNAAVFDALQSFYKKNQKRLSRSHP